MKHTIYRISFVAARSIAGLHGRQGSPPMTQEETRQRPRRCTAARQDGHPILDLGFSILDWGIEGWRGPTESRPGQTPGQHLHHRSRALRSRLGRTLVRVDGAPYPASGDLAHGHGDALISAALCVLPDDQDWRWTGTAEIPARTEPLNEIDQGGW